MRLLYANSSPADVLLKAELEAFAREHDNFRVWFTGVPAALSTHKLTSQPLHSLRAGSMSDAAQTWLMSIYQRRSMSVVNVSTRPVCRARPHVVHITCCHRYCVYL